MNSNNLDLWYPGSPGNFNSCFVYWKSICVSTTSQSWCYIDAMRIFQKWFGEITLGCLDNEPVETKNSVFPAPELRTCFLPQQRMLQPLIGLKVLRNWSLGSQTTPFNSWCPNPDCLVANPDYSPTREAALVLPSKRGSCSGLNVCDTPKSCQNLTPTNGWS